MKDNVIILVKTFLHKSLKTSLFVFLIGSFITPIPAKAQETNQNILTLERIFKENEFKLNQYGPAVWLEDGSGYTTLEGSVEFPRTRDIVKYNPESGKRSVLVKASQLIPE